MSVCVCASHLLFQNELEIDCVCVIFCTFAFLLLSMILACHNYSRIKIRKSKTKIWQMWVELFFGNFRPISVLQSGFLEFSFPIRLQYSVCSELNRSQCQLDTMEYSSMDEELETIEQKIRIEISQDVDEGWWKKMFINFKRIKTKQKKHNLPESKPNQTKRNETNRNKQREKKIVHRQFWQCVLCVCA